MFIDRTTIALYVCVNTSAFILSSVNRGSVSVKQKETLHSGFTSIHQQYTVYLNGAEEPQETLF